MFRRALLIFVTIAFIAGLVYSYFYFREIKRPVSDAWNTIPTNAAFIIQCNGIKDSWNKLSQTNLIWEELQETSFFGNLDERLHHLDSISSGNVTMQELIASQTFLVSAHRSGANDFNYLFVFSLPATYSNATISEFQRQLAPDYTSTQKNHDGAQINILKNSEGRTFSYSVYKDIFIGSVSIIQVEASIRQLNSGNSLVNDKAFRKILETSGTGVDAGIIVNHRQFPNLSDGFLSNEALQSISPLSGYANWSALDLKIKPNALLLNGFTYSNDSAHNLLNLFSGQSPQEIDMVGILPDNTALLIHYGWSDFEDYYEKYTGYLDAAGSLTKYESAIRSVNDTFECSLKEHILSWIGNEGGLVITEPRDSNYSANVYGILKSRDMNATTVELNKLIGAVSGKRQQDTDTVTFMGFTICRLGIPGLLKKLLGSTFSPLSCNYFTVLNDYVVFASSRQALKGFINKLVSERTLSKDLNYAVFSENLSSASNIFIYSNLARSPHIYQSFTNAENTTAIRENLDLFRQFEAVALQVSNEHDNLFYNNIYLKHNPAKKQESASLWETMLDTTVSMKPTLVLNHYTGAKEVFVQDEGNKLYLISNTGKILWKKQVEETIMGSVTQIDALKNNKLQLLFNTKSRIHLLDRNGHDVKGFPVLLKAEASNPLSVFDYERNKIYRILVACHDNAIYNYDQHGQLVAGWDFAGSEAPIRLPIKHFALNGKDYIVAVDSAGKVYVVNRQGQERIKLEQRLPISNQTERSWRDSARTSSPDVPARSTVRNELYIEVGKDLVKSRMVTVDSAGQVHKLYFDGREENTILNKFNPGFCFRYADLDGDNTREYIFLDGPKLLVYTQNKALLFEYEFDSTIAYPPMVFTLSEGEKELGVLSSTSNQIFLLNSVGLLHENFPLFGSTPFTIGDINKDGTLNLVVGGPGKTIYAYTLEPH